jgi:hypothetical protein
MEVSGQLHARLDLPLEEIVLDINWIGDWVGPRAGLDTVEKKKSLALPGIEPRPSSP